MMNSTNFANSKQRVIRMGPRGGFYALKADGQKKRNPVAKFRKATDGSMVKLTKANLPNVPEAIRPARAAAAKATVARPRLSPGAKATKVFQAILNKPPRKVRKNKGVLRVAPKARASPKPRGRKPASDSVKATKMFAKILNKQVAPPKVKANKLASKNVMVLSPGGTIYKSKRSMMARTRAANLKKMRRKNPFAALNKALMR